MNVDERGQGLALIHRDFKTEILLALDSERLIRQLKVISDFEHVGCSSFVFVSERSAEDA